MRCLFILAAVLLCLIQGNVASQGERKLIDDLFRGYNKRVRPTEKANEPIQLQIKKIHLTKLTHYNKADGTMDVGFWAGFSWNDSVLRWNPSDYEGVERIMIRASEIWTPDIMLFSGRNMVPELSLREGQEHFDVLVSSNGLIEYYPSIKLKLPCLSDLNTQPGESECTFSLGPWLSSTDLMRVTTKYNTLDTEKCVVDSKYNIKTSSIEYTNRTWDNETWEYGVATIVIAKR